MVAVIDGAVNANLSAIICRILAVKEVFKSSECAIIEKRIEYFKYFNGHQNGGRIEYLNKKIYLKY